MSLLSSSPPAIPLGLRRLRVTRRIALAIVMVTALPLILASVARAADDPYNVLVFTKNATVGASEGAAALQSAVDPAVVTLDVSDDATKFTQATLDDYRAVVFLNTSGDVLNDEQQTAFENYYRNGGGFLGIGSVVETEPGWQFLTDILGTRSSSRTDATAATIKVADQIHDASKDLPEYWGRTDRWYNFTSNVRGFSHVLATVDETTFTGGTMGHDHPVAWCKDFRGGRSFYVAGGGTAESFDEPDFRKHLGGALTWAAGKSDKVYSDCGATVLANYQQTKISAPPNLLEPIGFDVLPGGRVIQTSRGGTVRLHNPETGTTSVLATIPVYTNSEDGLYGPAIDNDFANNKWVYLYYAPQTVSITKCDGTQADVTTPTGSAPTVSADPCVWQDTWGGYFQLSRFKFLDGPNPSLDLASEQKIMQVANNRGACCHVAGDIDFDKHNNLWLATGDDTPAGGGNSGGFSPFNDMKTNETQTVRVNNATGGTFTLTFNGQTTEPIPFNATSAATQSALEALSNIEVGDVLVTGNAVNTGNQTIAFRGQYTETDVEQATGNASGLTGTSPTVAVNPGTGGNLFNSPHVDARRSSLNTNDLRGKILRITVAEDGSYTSPADNLFPEIADPGDKTRPEIYAMGFRNPFRIQVDKNDVAYVTDYSPDSQTPQNFRGPAGTGRLEIVRAPSNYAWPACYSPTLPYYKWNFNLSTPLDPANPEPFECDNATQGPENTSRWNTGLTVTPPVTQPDVWYSYRDNQVPPLGTPCLASYDGTNGVCPQLFPELGTGGVGPHGAAKYDYDPNNPNPNKLPPYYDGSVFFGEFTRDYLKEIRLDSQNDVFKINSLFDCGQVANNSAFPFECDNPMDMQFGPDGTFYLLTYGDGFFAANQDAGMYKWEYVKGQRAPVGVLNADKTDGSAALTVQFSSAGTRDADPADALSFEWDFTNDGVVDSTDPNPSHTYSDNGVYTAKMVVTDSSGKTDSKSTVITVGNTSPKISISVPENGGFFEWGQHIPYTVTVTDDEDASIDCSTVEVTFVLIHEQHGHGEDSRTGCSGYLDTDAADASHGGYLAGGVSATYTDTGGAGGIPSLTTVKQVVVQLKRQQLEYSQDNAGTTIGAAPGAEPDPGGGQVRGSLDPGDYIAINNPVNLTGMNKQITFRYAGGANGLAVGTDRAGVEIRLDSPTGPIVQTVTLKSTGTNNNTYSSQTFPLDFDGSHKLYFVIRAVPGGPATGFGNLNWVEFSGAGIGLPTDTPPTTSVAFSPQQPACSGSCIGISKQSLVTLDADDDVHVATTEYRIDGGDWQAYSAPFKLNLPAGLHTFEYRSTDVDGNAETIKSESILFNPSADSNVGGTVSGTLSLTVGPVASFGSFSPGVARTYNTSTAASVTSTAGDAALTVSDPADAAVGHLVNGAFSLANPLEVAAGGLFGPIGGAATPTTLKTWAGPVSSQPVTVGFRQSIGATEGLRTGTYAKTLVFSLTTTSP